MDTTIHILIPDQLHRRDIPAVTPEALIWGCLSIGVISYLFTHCCKSLTGLLLTAAVATVAFAMFKHLSKESVQVFHVEADVVDDEVDMD